MLPMLERFKKLYLWFDDDVPGQEAVERLARKLGKDRCFVVRSRPRAGTTSTAKVRRPDDRTHGTPSTLTAGWPASFPRRPCWTVVGP